MRPRSGASSPRAEIRVCVSLFAWLGLWVLALGNSSMTLGRAGSRHSLAGSESLRRRAYSSAMAAAQRIAAYEQVEKATVRGSGERKLVDRASLVRWATKTDDELLPHGDVVEFRHGATSGSGNKK